MTVDGGDYCYVEYRDDPEMEEVGSFEEATLYQHLDGHFYWEWVDGLVVWSSQSFPTQEKCQEDFTNFKMPVAE